MEKRNYDNALTKLFEGKEGNDLDLRILTLEGDELYREIAYVLTELSLIDGKSGKKMISESERRLIEEGFFDSVKKAWKNLWGDANKQAEKQTGQKLDPKQQQAIKKTQEKIAELTKKCTEREQGLWDVSFAGTDTRKNEKEWMEKMVKSCVEKMMKGPEGKSIIGKLGDFLRGTIAGRALTGLIAVGAIASILGSATGVLGSTVDIETTSDGPQDSDFDNSLAQDLNDPVGDQASDLASQQGVDIKDNAPIHVGIDFDTGSDGLNQGQQQKIDTTSQQILKSVQDRLDDGHTDITVDLNVQGNASNDSGPNWNHNNDTGGDNLNQDRANVINKTLEPLVKKLTDMGVKVNLTKTIGDKGSSVDPGSQLSDATETGTIGIGIDSKAPTTTDTEWTPGPIKNYERDFRTDEVSPLCKYIDGDKVVPMNPGLIIYSYIKLDKGEIKTKEDGRTFSGIIDFSDSGDKVAKIKVLGGFTTPKGFEHDKLQSNSNYIVFEVLDPSIEGEWVKRCNASEPIPTKDVEDPEKGDGEPDKGGEPEGVDPTTPEIPADFLKGNRNMQLAHLAKTFLPGGESLWSGLGLKDGTVLPTGFFDAALGQGKSDPEKYLEKYYKYLVKNNAFTEKLNRGAWLAKVHSNENLALIRWIRNTRKSIGSFFKKFQSQYEDLGLGKRSQAFVTGAGQLGKGMGITGESLNKKDNLITEAAFNNSAKKAGFREDLLMKNLPQFMEMLTSMYFGLKGKKIGYDKEAVMKRCKEYGCKGLGGKKFKRRVDPKYYIMDDENSNGGELKEEIKRIRQLMK